MHILQKDQLSHQMGRSILAILPSRIKPICKPDILCGIILILEKQLSFVHQAECQTAMKFDAQGRLVIAEGADFVDVGLHEPT